MASLPELPCGPILELHGQRKRFHVPYGLKPLLEDITREVLRSQPENIYIFLAEFLEIRAEKKRQEELKHKQLKSWERHRWSWQGSSVLSQEELDEFMGIFHVNLDDAHRHATKIQAAYRGFKARNKVKEIRRLSKLSGPSGGTTDEEGLEEEGKDGSSKTRKSWEKHRWSTEEKSVLPPETLKEFLDDLEKSGIAVEKVEEKAVVIQSAFRGYMARKQMKEKRASLTREGGDAAAASGPSQETTEPTASETEEEETPATESAAEEGEPSQSKTVEEAEPSPPLEESTTAASEITQDAQAEQASPTTEETSPPPPPPEENAVSGEPTSEGGSPDSEVPPTE